MHQDIQMETNKNVGQDFNLSIRTWLDSEKWLFQFGKELLPFWNTAAIILNKILSGIKLLQITTNGNRAFLCIVKYIWVQQII